MQTAAEPGRHVITKHSVSATGPDANCVVGLVRIRLEVASDLPDLLHVYGDSRPFVGTVKGAVENEVGSIGLVKGCLLPDHSTVLGHTWPLENDCERRVTNGIQGQMEDASGS